MNFFRYITYIASTAIISNTAQCRPAEEKSRDQVKPWESPCMASGQGDPVSAQASFVMFEGFDDLFADSEPVSVHAHVEEVVKRCAEAGDLANDLKEDIMNKKIQSQQMAGSLTGLHLSGFTPLNLNPVESVDEINHILQVHTVHIQTASVILHQLLMDEDDVEIETKTKELNEKLLGILCLLEETLTSRTGHEVSNDIVDSDSISQRFSVTKSTANRASRSYVFVRDLSESLNVQRAAYSQIVSKLS